jgi:hypothetical protein
MALTQGYSKTDEHFLERTDKGGVVSFKVADDPSSANTDELLIEFSMNKQTFADKYAYLMSHPCWSGIF